ncbi:hypothetical protein Pmani_020231 [Petrolisthes manimaculis]|uniref:Uncharacterized protein n=1 Tax=Petrolisthes manimaculis TaxID=1843537 RepID=A0AAE1PH11_9EUCA|nr:hypothetical protein Pmani_020231 [Petrolisthes manimaculis]
MIKLGLFLSPLHVKGQSSMKMWMEVTSCPTECNLHIHDIISQAKETIVALPSCLARLRSLDMRSLPSYDLFSDN